jgi:hypothetical protein
MSIQKARQLLGEEYKDLSNEEIEKLVDMLKSICSIVVENYINRRDS